MTTFRARLPYAEAAKALLRDTLFDAAGELLRDKGWSDLTMADVAAAAGVSRQTLYKEFGSRPAFAQEYILREVDRFLSAVEEAVRANALDPHAAVTAAFEVFLAAAADQPLVKAIVAGDGGDGLLNLVTNQAGPVLSEATTRLTACLKATWPQVEETGLRFVAENLVRLAVSHAASPTAQPARGVAAVFGPYLDSLVTAQR
ncbi:TetR/AcrR family transcriptional regulator [Actinokineospora sp. G85]|uniref:TetR/AcrR family transcriptional regulator n=1 Tax=Actinokineospora sp. G85 TaxID=3406626 RepID=UPI003C745D1E